MNDHGQVDRPGWRRRAGGLLRDVVVHDLAHHADIRAGVTCIAGGAGGDAVQPRRDEEGVVAVAGGELRVELVLVKGGLPKSNVDADPARAGSAINQGKSAMPSCSAIICGWAIFLALMNRKLTNCVVKIAFTAKATFFLASRSSCVRMSFASAMINSVGK